MSSWSRWTIEAGRPLVINSNFILFFVSPGYNSAHNSQPRVSLLLYGSSSLPWAVVINTMRAPPSTLTGAEDAEKQSQGKRAEQAWLPAEQRKRGRIEEWKSSIDPSIPLKDPIFTILFHEHSVQPPQKSRRVLILIRLFYPPPVSFLFFLLFTPPSFHKHFYNDIASLALPLT